VAKVMPMIDNAVRPGKGGEHKASW